MASKPTIVIVPGSFSPALFYELFITQLNDAGYPDVHFVEYPSIGRKDPAPAATMLDDAAAIHKAVESLADEGRDILLIAHSYGGIPASESIRGLAKSQREADGKNGGIIRVLYATAIVPAVGESSSDIMSGDSVPPYLKINGDYMWLEPIENAQLNFSDLPYEEGFKWAKKAEEHSTISFTGALTYPGYKDVPVSYMYCEIDKTVPPEMQQRFIQTIERDSGNSVDIHKVKTGHFAFLSQPDIVIQVVRKICGETV
ncbi:alpha/beta-hydrolase [Rhizodiscina lignyota]|uniref:Alpha/beta-hydrolase n=1 Tax=Rhizodiscina lignyota TaxID=1504668 RepID=A0A9P4I3N8_9PEZI|nr:alpha/beta-hydrolase [Rhizodiscina lignyota]